MKRAASLLLLLTLWAVAPTAQGPSSFPGGAAVDKIFATWDTRDSRVKSTPGLGAPSTRPSVSIPITKTRWPAWAKCCSSSAIADGPWRASIASSSWASATIMI